MRVLAIDPGEKVGWAVGDIEDGPKLVVVKHGISTLYDFAMAMARSMLYGDNPYDFVLFEPYRITANKLKAHINSDVPTLQLIGMIRLLCWLTGTQIVKSPPSAKTSALMSMKHPEGQPIKAIIDSLPKAHDEAHNGDALMHLWTFYFERYI